MEPHGNMLELIFIIIAVNIVALIFGMIIYGKED